METPSPRAITLLAEHGEDIILRRASLLAMLVAGGHRVHVIARRLAPAAGAQAAEPNVSIEIVADNPRGGTLGDRALRKELTRRLSSRRPDAVLAIGDGLGVLGAAAAAACRVGTIVFAAGDGADLDPGPSWLARRRLASLLSGTTHALFDTDEALRRIRELHVLPATAAVGVHNGPGCDVDRIGAVPVPAVTGALSLCLPALSRHPALALGDAQWLAGALKQIGTASAPMLAVHILVAEAGLVDAIVHALPTAVVSVAAGPADVQSAIAASHVVLVGARPHVAPALLDAFAIGRAVIAARAPGRTRLVDEHVNGCLCDGDDQASLAEALRLVVGRPDLLEAMGRASRAKAERSLDARLVNRRLIAALTGSPSPVT